MNSWMTNFKSLGYMQSKGCLENTNGEPDILPLDNRLESSQLDLLRSRDLEVVDNRPIGGLLGILGGEELRPLMDQFVANEIWFKYTSSGKASGYRPAWYTYSNA